MKEQKRVPKLRFKEFSEEWQSVNLGEVSNVYDGTHQTPKYTKQGIPFVSVENISDIDNTDKFISKSDYEKDFKIKPLKGDILMTRITAGVIGATSIIKNNSPLAYYVSLALIRNKKNSFIDSEFLEKYINSVYFKKELHRRIIHIAFPKKINLGEINLCKVSYSTINEQQKIASFLSAVDKKIAQLQQKKRLLEQYKKGAMLQIFPSAGSGQVPQLRFTREDGSAYPDWEEKRLGEVCDINKGKQLNAEFLTEDAKYPCINGGIFASGFTDNFNREKNTITISEGGNSCGFVNFLETKFWCGGHCYSLDDLVEKVNNSFLYQYLKHKQDNIMRMRVGSGLPNIQKKDILKFNIKIPCLEEQFQIAEFLRTIDKKIAVVQTQIEHTQQFKKGLLQQLFV